MEIVHVRRASGHLGAVEATMRPVSSNPVATTPRHAAEGGSGTGASTESSGEIAKSNSGNPERASDPQLVAGRYKIQSRIAEGGMGVVYKAEHALSRKKLAVKILHPHLCHGRQAVERFQREVSAAAEIDHPGIVQVFDAGIDADGSYYMAMELLEGESLGASTRREWPGTKSAVKLIIAMCEPLARAHEKGFVHRDLKPDNVFIATDHSGNESVKLLDFGLVREVSRRGSTQSGVTFGTPEYMAPEQAMSAKKAGVSADVWSVGVMLYELLAGQHPFTGETANAVMANAIKDPHPPLGQVAPHVPRELARVVEQCLHKEPAKRPKDAAELAALLKDVLERVPLDEQRPPNPRLREDGEDDSADRETHLSSAAPLPLAVREVRTRAEWTHAMRDLGAVWPWMLGGAIALLLVLGIALWRGGHDVHPVDHGLAASAAEGMASPEPLIAPPRQEDVALAASPPVAPSPDSEEVGAEEDDIAEDELERGRSSPRSRVRRPARARPVQEAEAGDEAPAAPVPEMRSSLQEARACLARGDIGCATAVLEQGQSAAELALLVDVYQMQGRVREAQSIMRQYIERFPRGPQSENYRRALGLEE